MKILALFIFLFTTSQCTKWVENSKHNRAIDFDTNGIDQVQLVDFKLKEKEIQLESTDSCLISVVSDLITINDKIVILDENLQSIFIFHQNGVFERRVSNSKWQNKWTRYFKDLTRNGDFFSVIDIINNSILEYSLEGHEMRIINVPVFARQHEWIDKQQLLLLTPQALFNKKHNSNLSIFNIAKNELYYVSKCIGKRNSGELSIRFSNLVRNGSNFYSWDSYNHYFEIYNSETKTIDKIFINNSKNPSKEQYASGDFFKNDISNFIIPIKFISIDNRCFVELIRFAKRSLLIFDISNAENNPVFFENTGGCKSLLGKSNQGINYPIWPQGLSNDSTMFQAVDPVEYSTIIGSNDLDNKHFDLFLKTNPLIRLFTYEK